MRVTRKGERDLITGELHKTQIYDCECGVTEMFKTSCQASPPMEIKNLINK
jgi:hypothetical protein